MSPHLSALAALLLVLAFGAQAQAACTAANPNANVIETTPTSAFTDNLNGTVTHALTGLMWKQCAQGQSGASCGIGSASTLNWSDALKAAAADRTAGYTDWRLPNKKELESIVEFCGYRPAINQTLFPATPASPFWSASSNVSDPAQAWYVSFNDGSTVDVDHRSVYKSEYYYARLVRGGQSFDSFDALNTAPVKSYTGTLPTGPGNITAAFTGGNTSCAYATSQFTTSATAPAGITLTYGVFNFTTNDCGSGAALNFTITYPQNLPAGTRYYKYGPEFGASQTPHWYVLSGAVVNGNQISFAITDNGVGDSNPAAGFITDPGGPGVPDGSAATAIPTLSEWGLIILASLMALFAMGQLPRVRRR